MQNAEFYDKIDEKILGLLKSNRDFNSLMKCAKGIHPLDILKSLNRLKQRKAIDRTKAKQLINSAKLMGNVAPDNTVHYFPVPHLLDYDWRFSKNGIVNFSKYIRSYISSTTQRIVFMGTPSLFVYFSNKWPILCNYTLLDQNASLYKNHVDLTLDNINICECDIANIFEISFFADIIVMDPPWYLEYNKMFIGMGAKLCHQNSVIMCVTAPFFTRPTIDFEYKELLSFTNSIGLSVEKYKKTCIRYSTPPFEQNTLKANGILCLPNDWRAGDLLILRKSDNIYITKNSVPTVQKVSDWKEISIGLVRFRYKKNFCCRTDGSITLCRIYDNDIYPSVSRRFVGSEQINVWTSGNRVWHCDNLKLLDIILTNWKEREHLSRIMDSILGIDFDDIAVKKIVVLIEDIVKIESIEYGRWV